MVRCRYCLTECRTFINKTFSTCSYCKDNPARRARYSLARQKIANREKPTKPTEYKSLLPRTSTSSYLEKVPCQDCQTLTYKSLLTSNKCITCYFKK